MQKMCMVKYRIGIYFMFPIQMRKGESEMNKYGQAEYAYGIMKKITEKLLENKISTEEQFKQPDSKNKADCFDNICTVTRVNNKHFICFFVCNHIKICTELSQRSIFYIHKYSPH